MASASGETNTVWSPRHKCKETCTVGKKVNTTEDREPTSVDGDAGPSSSDREDSSEFKG